MQRIMDQQSRHEFSGPATKGDVTILGQNVDWHPDSTVDLVRTGCDYGKRLLGLFLNGYGGCYLSSEGFGNCANMTLCPPATVKDHVPFAIYLYSAMRKKSAKEAMGVLEQISRGVGYVHVADSSGYIAGICLQPFNSDNYFVFT